MIRILLVDDEPLARRGIRARLAREHEVEIVGEASDGREAVRLIRECTPDLVFLDLQMPELGGFEVIEEIGPDAMPAVIFVTAYDAHAIRAFEVQALDYLLKPVDDARFARAFNRARDRLAERREGDFGRRLSAALATAGLAPGAPAVASEADRAAARHVDRFLVRKTGRVLLVRTDEVDWIEAAGDYVRLHAGRESHLLRETMARIEEQLDPAQFVRIHRSTIVNISRVRELHPYVNREYTVVLRDGTELKLSRGYRDRVEALFGGAL